MKYAVSNWIYGDEPLETTFDRLSRCGYDGVELKYEPGQYSAAEVRRLCDRYRLQALSLAGMYPLERDLANPDPEVRRQATEYLRAGTDFAREVGASLIIVVPSAVGKTGPVGELRDEGEWEDAGRREWGYAVESVRRAAGYAESRGIILAIEPINRYESYLVNTAGQGLRFISEVGSDSVRLHLDTFHMNIEEADPAGAILAAGDRLVNLHLSDSNRQAIGRGHYDFAALLAALEAIGYTGALTLEPLPPVPDAGLATRLKRYMAERDVYALESITRLRDLSRRG